MKYKSTSYQKIHIDVKATGNGVAIGQVSGGLAIGKRGQKAPPSKGNHPTRKIKAVAIEWDVDNQDVDLPVEISIPDNLTDLDEISDYLSEVTGFCHLGFTIAYEKGE